MAKRAELTMLPDTGDMKPLDDGDAFGTSDRSDEIARRNGMPINLSHMQREVLTLSGVQECLTFSVPAPGAVGDHVVLAVQTDLPEASIQYEIRRLFSADQRPDLLHISHRLPRTASGALSLDDLKAMALDRDARFTPL